MKKSGKIAGHVLISNNAINSLATLQISLSIVALFEKIYYESSDSYRLFKYLCFN